MDEFEKEYPEFDWRNTPSEEHPRRLECPCPRHEYLREVISCARQSSTLSRRVAPVLKFCPGHYRVCMEELIPRLSLYRRIMLRIALKTGRVRLMMVDSRSSDMCYYCRFGTGGHEKENEIHVE